MLTSLDVNNQSEWNESKRKGTIDAHDILLSMMKNEFIVPDEPDFNDVCTKGDDSFYSPNNVAVIKREITIDSDDYNGDSFVKIWDSDTTEIMSTNSPIHDVYNDNKVSEYSPICLNCGITTNELVKQTEWCEATKSFICSVCSFKCCRKNNLEYHMQNDHKIPINYGITSYFQEVKMTKSMNNSSNETSPRKTLIVDREKVIDMYCEKCGNISRPRTILLNEEPYGLCQSRLFYQCTICKMLISDRQGILLIYNNI